MASGIKRSLAEKYELLACMQCGKCTSGCPVSLKSPLNIRRLVREVMLGRNLKAPEREELWDCTTCSTCSIRCPRGLEPHELIIGIRGSLIEEGHVPVTVRDALEGVFEHGNPWGRIKGKRSEWATDLGVKDLSQGKKSDTLYFVGCAASYDPRVQKVAKALVKSLFKAGVDFGILGTEETCCGSEVRRMGEEALFEMLKEDNLKLFHGHGIKQIITTSPHCFDVFKNKYNDSKIKIMHYTQFVADLIRSGKLTFSGKLERVVTYQDPCYLGKQSNIYDEPRDIIKAIPGIAFIDFDRSREKGLCCEGGGGRMWVEGTGLGERLAEIRIKDALEMGVDTIATACPFCLSTLEDAVKATGFNEKIEIKDIVELVAEAI
ncbi:(Fe-S)-binding protein [Chloroflexota bacterium]